VLFVRFSSGGGGTETDPGTGPRYGTTIQNGTVEALDRSAIQCC
jgi:hypothetical protein